MLPIASVPRRYLILFIPYLHGHKVTENHYLYQPVPWIFFLQDSDAKAVQQVVWSVGFSFRACDFLSVNTASKFQQGKDLKRFQAHAEKK